MGSVRRDGDRPAGRDLRLHHQPRLPAAFVRAIKPIHTFVYNKWFFDELYNFLFVRPAFALGRIFWKAGDVGFIDRFGPNGAAWVVVQGTVWPVVSSPVCSPAMRCGC
jgi:NADH:ubiquinone oxidoreductase subunit 5 (subunit L)/multisubunit Na+/H+ antiporter MnhA subunit